MNPRSLTVSVIIPTYNRAELVRETLESVLAQTHQRLEILVVDDGSTDHTEEVLAGFGDRIHTIRLGRSGIGAARNSGIEAATGDYIAFLDSDDLWLPTKVEKHLDFAVAHPEMVLTYTDAVQFNQDGPAENSFVDKFTALRDPAHLFAPMITEFAIPLTSTTMIQTSFLKETGLRFPVELGLGEDLSLFLQMMLAGAEFGYLPEKLTRRRMHGNNVSSNHRKRFEQRKRLYTDLLGQSPNGYTREQRSALKAGLQDARYRVGECLWEELNLKEARKEFIQALSLDKRGMKSAAYGVLTFLPARFVGKIRKMKPSGK